MAKEIEKCGIPVAVLTALPNVARNIGVSRVVQGSAITTPSGNGEKTGKEELEDKIKLIKKALNAISSEVKNVDSINSIS